MIRACCLDICFGLQDTWPLGKSEISMFLSHISLFSWCKIDFFPDFNFHQRSWYGLWGVQRLNNWCHVRKCFLCLAKRQIVAHIRHKYRKHLLTQWLAIIINISFWILKIFQALATIWWWQRAQTVKLTKLMPCWPNTSLKPSWKVWNNFDTFMYLFKGKNVISFGRLTVCCVSRQSKQGQYIGLSNTQKYDYN